MVSFLINVFVITVVCVMGAGVSNLVYEYLLFDNEKARIWNERVAGFFYTVWLLMTIYYGFHYLGDFYIERSYLVDWPLMARVCAVVCVLEHGYLKLRKIDPDQPERKEVRTTFYASILIVGVVAFILHLVQGAM